MVALRSPSEADAEIDERAPLWPRPNPADWLSLQQAACELNVSLSTVRRMIRKGRLRNRIVPRRGGFRYLIYLPNSRHALMQACRLGVPAPEPPCRLRLVDVAPAGPWRSDIFEEAPPAAEVRRLEAQVEHLSRSLSLALLAKQTSLPEGVGGRAGADPGDPYARYRWLARRRRRFWKF